MAENSRRPNHADRIRTSVAFFDCDNSPLLCDVFRISPVMLLYLETKPPCLVRKNYTFVCSKRWTYISLPLKKMPFERKAWINGLLVPVFPSALEQFRSLMLWEGSLDGLGLEEDSFHDTLAGSEGGGYTFEDIVEGVDDSYEDRLRELAEFLAFVQGGRAT